MYNLYKQVSSAEMDKALGKACELINDIFGACPVGQFDVELPRCEECDDTYVEC